MSGRTILSRRRFLALGAAATAGTVLMAACQPQTVEVTRVVEKQVEKPVEVTKVVERQVEKPVEVTRVVEKAVEKQVVVTPTPAPAVKGTVGVWTFPQTDDDMGKIWQPLMGKLKKQSPQIEAKVEVLPWSGRREKMMTAFAAGSPPDVAYVNTDSLSLFGSADALVDLTKLIPADVWSDYPEGVIKTGLSWKGKRVMVPAIMILSVRLANQDLLTSIGEAPDKSTYTWNELLSIGAKAKEKQLFLTNWNLTTWAMWVAAVWQAGGTTYNEDATKVLLNQPPAEEALNWLVNVFQNGFVPKEGAVASEQEVNPSAVNYFLTGKQVVSEETNATILDTIKAQAPKLKYTTVVPFKNKDQAATVSSGCWGIFSKSKNVDAAAAWLNFMLDAENMGFYCSAAGFAPPRNAANQFWIVDTNMKKLVNAVMPFSRLNQDCNYFWQEGKTTCAPFFQAAVLGKAKPKDALNDAQQALQKIVDAFWAKQK